MVDSWSKFDMEMEAYSCCLEWDRKLRPEEQRNKNKQGVGAQGEVKRRIKV